MVELDAYIYLLLELKPVILNFRLGLTNAPTTFAQVMNHIFIDRQLFFLNDMFLFSKYEEEHCSTCFRFASKESTFSQS